jgi:hypothetical protein
VYFLACTLAAMGCASPGQAAGPEDAPYVSHPAARNAAHWSLRLPEESKVFYQGEANFDGVGMGTTGMLYGPGPVIALAGLVAHGLLLAGGRSHQKTKVQEEADKVLVPYQPVLAEFRSEQLLKRGAELMDTGGVKSVTPHAQKAGTDWTIESEPVYSLTQDQRALILDNTLWIYPPGETEEKRYAYTVRVVSQPCAAAEPAGFWIANAGARLKEESAHMLARSLDVAVGIFSGATAPPASSFRTIRYPQGGAQRMERAQLVSASCDTLLIQSLRGWFLLVPSTPQERDAALEATCAQAAAAITPPVGTAPITGSATTAAPLVGGPQDAAPASATAIPGTLVP